MTAAVISPSSSREELAAKYLAPQRMGNWVRDCHPLSIAIVLVGCVAFAVTADNLLASAGLVAAYYLMGAVAGVRRPFALLYGRLSILAGGLMLLTRAFLIPGSSPWFQAGAVSLGLESIIRGLDFSLFVLAISGAVVLFFTVVPVKRLLASIGRNGADRRVSFVVLSAFQAISEVGVSTRTVLDAQRARGVETEGNPLRRIGAFVPVLGPVFLSALTATEERALALDARGFHVRGPRTRLVTVRALRGTEIVVALGVSALLVAGAVFIRLGAGQ